MKPHGYLLYLGPELYMAVVQLQAALKLGRTFSALLPLTEGLHHMGYLSEENYEKLKAKYSVSLIEAYKKPLTLKQLQAKAEVERLEKHYSDVLAQWPQLNKKAKLTHLRNAEKHAKDVRAAKLILDLAPAH